MRILIGSAIIVLFDRYDIIGGDTIENITWYIISSVGLYIAAHQDYKEFLS